jgi:hypothetical protein
MQFVDERHHLQVRVETKDCQLPADELSRLQPSLDRLGEAVAELAAAELWLNVVFHPKSQQYHAQAKLKVPGKTIHTGEQNAWLDTALLRSLERMIHHVEAYKDSPDRRAAQHMERLARLNDEIIAPVEPDAGELGAAVQEADYAHFRRALFSHEEYVRMRVGRWIQRYPEVQELIGRSFGIADLVEEVFLIAFERYTERPTHNSLHEWLDSLIDPAVKSFWHHPDDREAARFAQTVWQQTGKK